MEFLVSTLPCLRAYRLSGIRQAVIVRKRYHCFTLKLTGEPLPVPDSHSASSFMQKSVEKNLLHVSLKARSAYGIRTRELHRGENGRSRTGEKGSCQPRPLPHIPVRVTGSFPYPGHSKPTELHSQLSQRHLYTGWHDNQLHQRTI